MTRRWTREDIDAELRAIASGTIGYGLSGGDPVKSARNFLDAVVVRDLLAERDELAAPPVAAAATYRLPDWLGGHEVFSPGEVGDDRCRRVDVVLPDGSPGTLRVPAEYLVEIRPPSIDDPEPLPLELRDCADMHLLVRRVTDDLSRPQCVVAVGLDRGEPLHLDAAGARRVARALWQRANAVESTSDGA